MVRLVDASCGLRAPIADDQTVARAAPEKGTRLLAAIALRYPRRTPALLSRSDCDDHRGDAACALLAAWKGAQAGCSIELMYQTGTVFAGDDIAKEDGVA